ncbi:MAG: alcohol dehydrogenase catalytic domain-containing protein [Terriglobales bacterium]
MSKMKAVQVSKPGGNFELVERNILEPARNQVRIKIEACGICHSDALVKEGYWPGIQYPRVPGHEIAGRIDAVGADVTNWKPGQRVGVGWHGGHDFTCDDCRRGDFVNCRSEKITGISFDGGYQEYMIAPAEAVAAIPEEIPAAEAAPLLCAGITVSMHFATQARALATSLQCRVSADLDISESNMPVRWASAPSP